jgi:2-hydroxychromene-2-carboxylate isomerase|tara:strand:+ start:2465 stop:3769 length:1305 start_codon:yes stop_codon:yes gene_type:complete
MSANIRNQAMNTFSSRKIFEEIRTKSETVRQKEDRPHEVLYFHKVDDPYSHLTIQYINKFKSSFDVTFKPVLVGEEDPESVHEPSLYSIYCLEDVKKIAPFYGVEFSADVYPSKELVAKANKILTSLDDASFGEIASSVSSALWEENEEALNNLSLQYQATDNEVKIKLTNGNEIRNNKGYYFGSAFYYEKELYWGVDRLHYLEDRLTELGVKNNLNNESVCQLELKAPAQLTSEKKVNLYYYPSLNSPYTFVSSNRVREMQDEYPINLITQPVLPMLMRKMTIPGVKAKYIISDAAREGRKHGYEMKSIYSPIGKPARKAYSLFPIINEAGRGFDYINALLKSSFQDGVNIGDEDYLEDLVTKLDLDWMEIKKELNTNGWKKILNDNLEDMYAGDCWGVPSFKITNEDGSNPFYVWGQDRMWLLKEEINKRLS